MVPNSLRYKIAQTKRYVKYIIAKLFAAVVGVATGCAVVGMVGIFLWLVYSMLNWALSWP